MNKFIYSIGLSLGSAYRPPSRIAWQWFFCAVATGSICVLAGRIGIALGSSILLCATYAIPAALTRTNLSLSFVSFSSVTAVGLFFLHEETTGSRLGLVLVGISFAAATFYISMGAGARIAEARKGLGKVRYISSIHQLATANAGVCVVVVDRGLTWRFVNSTAWSAFGGDPLLRDGLDERFELDNDAATTLLHSASQDSWRAFLESSMADVKDKGLIAGECLPPYSLQLFNRAGVNKQYRFTATVGQMDEILFVGVPCDHLPSEKQGPGPWFRAVVDSIGDPAILVQSDGSILASNEPFKIFSGCKGDEVDFLYECLNVRGVNEGSFLTSVWLPTSCESTSLPLLHMDSIGSAVAARIVDPAASHAESILIVFNNNEDLARPVPRS